ncbi:MAG TPA: MATE family efflux transporter, partial [Bacilli bacterium]|nr:MATE family efflux transporter [Bacilli bacterium]
MTNILRSKKLDELGIKNEIPKTSKLINDILKISLPAAAETFLVGLVGLMDTIMVGSLGKEAISSVSITQQPVYITLTFCFGLTAGIIAIVSRRFGQNDREGANKALRQTLVLGTIISSIITILSLVFGRAFIKLAGA